MDWKDAPECFELELLPLEFTSGFVSSAAKIGLLLLGDPEGIASIACAFLRKLWACAPLRGICGHLDAE
jgi:hypothetical protein